jgi:multiple sugar transport system ATP-binding protein
MSDAVRQQLARGAGRDLIIGVRPEHFADAALVSPQDKPFGTTFTAPIDVMESTGSDVYVYFTHKGGPPKSTHLEELASDSGRAEATTTDDQIVARLSTATKIKEGDSAQLWVDLRGLHLFDAQSGRNLALAGATDTQTRVHAPA